MFANNRNRYFFKRLKIRSGDRKCVNCFTVADNLNSVRFDTGRVNLDPKMMCADWPVAGNLALFQTQVIVKLKS